MADPQPQKQPVCTCPETDPDVRYTVAHSGLEPHAITCPRHGTPVTPMTDHHVEWTIDNDGIHGDLQCTADPDAQCRSVPPCDCCETFVNPELMRHADGTLHWAHPAPEADGAWHYHTLGGQCNPIEWVTNDDAGLAELYRGTQHPLDSGPVEFVWTGYGYGWRYTDEQAVEDD